MTEHFQQCSERILKVFNTETKEITFYWKLDDGLLLKYVGGSFYE